MRTYGLLLLGILTALPALAGQAYIPFVAADPPGFDSGRSGGPSVVLYNQGSVARRYTVTFVPAGASGVSGGEILQTDTIAPQSFAGVSCCDRLSGVLVVSGAPQIAVGADFVEMLSQPQPNGVVTRLPVLTARDAVPAHGSALLLTLAWSQNGIATSSLGILNLGSRLAHCSITGFTPSPASFSDLQDLLVQAGGMIALPDVLGQRIGSQGFSSYAARPTVTCDQPFYPFAINFVGGAEPGVLPWVEVIGPSVTLGNAP
jgi:hypothetical protein